jgi:transposase
MLAGVKRPCSGDLRERLLQAMDAGLPAAEIARAFGISPRSLRRWRQWARERGGVATKPRAGRPRRVGPDRWPRLRAQVEAHPDATLVRHCALWERATGVRLSPATMSRLLARLGLPLKKRP